VEPRPPGPPAGPLSHPDAKIAAINAASRRPAAAINPDERSGLGPAGLPVSLRLLVLTDLSAISHKPTFPVRN
jgi:hypothetical protein